MSALIGSLRPSLRRVRTWTHRHNGRRIADLERRCNLSHFQRFEAALNRHGRSFATSSAILEFGCAEGRLLQYVFEYAPAASVAGCDIRAEAIEACRRRFAAGRFVVNQPAPPLAFERASFDLIYSYSVFTHLSEPNHRAWLAELARRLAPGGIMLHTIHSEAYLRRAAMFSPEMLGKFGFTEPVETILRTGPDYLYVAADPAAPEYGHTVIRQAYVMREWPRSSGLEVAEFVEGAIEAYPEGCHDLVVLGPSP